MATDDTTDKTCTSKKYEFLKYLDEKISKNLFFFTANVQFPTNIRIKEDFYIDGDTIKFYEIVSGSLSAIPLSIENWKDSTINEIFLYNESKIFFGHITIHHKWLTNDVALSNKIRGNNGLVRPNCNITLIPDQIIRCPEIIQPLI